MEHEIESASFHSAGDYVWTSAAGHPSGHPVSRYTTPDYQADIVHKQTQHGLNFWVHIFPHGRPARSQPHRIFGSLEEAKAWTEPYLRGL